MGISSTTNRVAFSGDGSTLSFAFAYPFTATSELVVYTYKTSNATIALKSLGVDYTLTATANDQGIYPSGGSVVFGSAPASGYTVVIIRVPTFTQTYTLSQNGLISSTALVNELDFLTLLLQRLTDLASRSVRLNDGFGGTFDPKLPAGVSLAANETCALIINSSGTGLDIGPTTSQISSAQTYATAAAASATAAATSATAAATSATAAATSATAAATSATAAATSASAAASSAATALASVAEQITGSRASPSSIVAGTGIAFTGTYPMNTWFIQGSGGAVTVSANPQIAAGTTVGQKLRLIGRSNTNTVTLSDGTGLDLDGAWLGAASSTLDLFWDGTNWMEIGRSTR